jgi:ferredoxin
MAGDPIASPYLVIDGDRCVACADCVRICPARALRLRDDRPAVFPDRCIGCGECIRVCPAGAISAPTCEWQSIRDDHIPVALVSPVLYSQFPEAQPAEILLALRHMGFRHAVDMFCFHEMFQFAAEKFIRRNRARSKTGRNAPWPLLSSTCPVVTRLVASQFPDLIPHLLPIMGPVELMARDIHRRIDRKYALDRQTVNFYYIVPCLTRSIPSRASFLTNEAYEVKSLGINDIYADLRQQLRRMRREKFPPLPEDIFDHRTVGNSLGWAVSGGEIADMDIDRALAVSGLRETIAYLEKIEMGLFDDVEYIEFRTCGEGCVGGILGGIDRYLAKRGIQRNRRRSGPHRREMEKQFKYIRHLDELFDEGWFFKERNPERMRRRHAGGDAPLSLSDLAEIERLREWICGKNCAACGSPDCRTFAEDVVRGRANLEDCLEIRARKAGNAPEPPGGRSDEKA